MHKSLLPSIPSLGPPGVSGAGRYDEHGRLRLPHTGDTVVSHTYGSKDGPTRPPARFPLSNFRGLSSSVHLPICQKIEPTVVANPQFGLIFGCEPTARNFARWAFSFYKNVSRLTTPFKTGILLSIAVIEKLLVNQSSSVNERSTYLI